MLCCACCVLQLSSLGDAERVYIKPASSIGGSAPHGISSVATQRIVRQAAVAVKDLHSMAGHMHLDLKVNNLLVSVLPVAPLYDTAFCTVLSSHVCEYSVVVAALRRQQLADREGACRVDLLWVLLGSDSNMHAKACRCLAPVDLYTPCRSFHMSYCCLSACVSCRCLAPRSPPASR